MDLSKLINAQTLSETCNMVSCKVFTNEETGCVKKVVCEYVPKDIEKQDTNNTPLFRSQRNSK